MTSPQNTTPPPVPVRPNRKSISQDSTTTPSNANSDLASYYNIAVSPTQSHRTTSNADIPIKRTQSITVVDRVDNSKQLQQIAAQFAESHFDITQPNWRQLIKQGNLQREIKITREQHDRIAFLFNDVLILSKPAANNSQQLIMKQVIDLRDMTVENVAIKNPKRITQFICHTHDGQALVFNANNQSDKYDWISSIEATIQSWRQMSKSRQVERHERSMSSTELHQHKLQTMTLAESIVSHDDEVLLAMLSDRNDDPNTIDESGNSMLHTAVLANNSQAIMLLLSHGADINAINTTTGNTALHLACNKHAYGEAMLLVGKKADLNIENTDGYTPLWLLCCSDNKNIDLFKSVDVVNDTVDDESSDDDINEHKSDNELTVDEARKKFIELVKLMIESNADTDMIDTTTGLTLLQTLVQQNKIIAVQSLIECNVSLNTIDSAGRTALHFAVSTNSLQSVKLLLQLGSAPNIRDHQMNTPLHLARQLSIAVCLIMNGARCDLINIIKTKAAQFFDTILDETELQTAQHAIKEAQQHWTERSDTYTDGELVDETSVRYLDDTISDICLLCNAQFGLTVRKHHCKRCGILCCWYCSTKNFIQRTKPDVKHRCCDSCYNIMSHKQKHIDRITRAHRIRTQESENAVKQLQIDKLNMQAELDRKQAESNARIQARKELLAQQKAELAEKYGTTDTNKPQRQSSILSKASNMSSLMSDNKNALLERGEKLDELGNKSEQLENDASNFAALAKKLADKQKRPLGFLGF